jgi:hypothetical protein
MGDAGMDGDVDNAMRHPDSPRANSHALKLNMNEHEPGIEF